MDLKYLPVEVLGLILSHLIVEKPDGSEDISYISNARLVCRQWNTLAIGHLFRSLTLVHTTDGEFKPWNSLLQNEAIRRAVQRVVIHSGPDDLFNNRDYVTWNGWAYEGIYPAFVAAIDRIAELPNVKALRLRFSEKCEGVDCDTDWSGGVEVISMRLHTLEAVFNAIHQRASHEQSSNSTIRSLAIVNLQNLPIPEFASSSLFKAVTKDIDQLHLLITDEYTEGGPDHDIYCVERKQFEPYLQYGLLPLLSGQLTSLSLCFQECWGVTPGYFDGKGLLFPNLKNLALGNFIIGHYDQFYWVLAHTSLESLRLNRCFIASHLSIEMPLVDETRKHDWQRCAAGSYGHEEDRDAVYTFSGTWETVFDDIRTRLSKLKVFCCSYGDVENHFCRAETVDTRLSTSRYITFEWGLLPSPWIETRQPNSKSGEISFGDQGTTSEGDFYKGVVNRAAETAQGDNRALEALLEAVRERQ
ncbi:hypothetical protein QQZ08_012476 [Neonectria magnoliae]|uniref:F-box domain-containing protein n=1 Tax=Neonectria magnoliae TaxID=2732573 RepID=A0ABR1H1E8_9HYPO